METCQMLLDEYLNTESLDAESAALETEMGDGDRLILITGFPGKKKRTKHQHIVSMFGPIMVRVVGVEPTRITAQEPKSCASANSAIPAYISGKKNCRYFLLFGTARGQDEAQICYLCLCSILSVMLPSLLIFLVALIIEPSG